MLVPYCEPPGASQGRALLTRALLAAGAVEPAQQPAQSEQRWIGQQHCKWPLKPQTLPEKDNMEEKSCCQNLSCYGHAFVSLHGQSSSTEVQQGCFHEASAVQMTYKM